MVQIGRGMLTLVGSNRRLQAVLMERPIATPVTQQDVIAAGDLTRLANGTLYLHPQETS
jgi:hypothetical protein